MNNIIAWWSGAIVDIPTGWSICDGNGGRPDLRNQFLYCAGGFLNPDDSGGAIEHNHDFTVDSHDHRLLAGANVDSANQIDHDTDFKQPTGTTDNADSRPAYHALPLIMKD